MANNNEQNVLPMVCSVTLFEHYMAASTFHQILNCFSQLCLGLQLDPLDYQSFYHRLKTKLTNWKAQKLWTLLDKRSSQKEYRKQKACQNLRVLVIGAGPCGLRMAIECALLGCKVVLLEKRDRFSRNNVLHIWPFVIQDLKNLGAKLFYPKFCAGSIDHISIRQLQCVLLKVALLLGVEVHENVSFIELLEPTANENGEKIGWRAKVSPETHYLSEYEFDALIGADGKRNTVPGFRRKEFRGKLAIAITANFINRHTEAEERVQEISGVAFIFNQQFFKDMKSRTGIDLENIVYYKDETHYFVMTAKKQSLLDKNVIIEDSDDISMLLDPGNIDQGALMSYAREAADFASEGKLPHVDFAYNHNALPDVAMFDFTSLFSAENSCRLFERQQCRLIVGIVGDSLHEPFWPTGSGCARGFLSVLDAAWMLKNYCSSKSLSPLDVLAQRESVYRLLAQTTTENLNKNVQLYTIDPKSRYPSFDITILPNQVRSLIDTDDWSTVEVGQACQQVGADSRRSTAPRRSAFDGAATYSRHQHLIRWYQQIVQPFRMRVDNLTQSFRSGLVLNAVLHRFRPDTTPDLSKLKPSEVTVNCNRAFEIVRSEFGLDPPLSVCDRSLMYDYLYRLYDSLKSESPTVLIPSVAQRTVVMTSLKRKSPDQPFPPSTAAALPVLASLCDNPHGGIDEKTKERHRRRLEHLNSKENPASDDGGGGSFYSKISAPVKKTFTKKPEQVEKLPAERLKEFEKMFLENLSLRKREFRAKKPILKTRKLERREIEEMEDKLRLTAMGHLLAQSKAPPEPNLSTKDAKIIAEKTVVLKQKAEAGFQPNDRYDGFDKVLTNLDKKLKLPNRSGAVDVATLLQQHNENITALQPSLPVGLKKKAPVPLPHEKVDSDSDSSKRHSSCSSTTVVVDNGSQQQRQMSCYFCNKRVYLAEKLTIEGVSCHVACFRCDYCQCKLRLNAYGVERLDVENDGRYVRHFFCFQHLNFNLAEKMAKLKSSRRQQTSTVGADTVDASDPTVIEFKRISNDEEILSPVSVSSTATVATADSRLPVFAHETPERAEFEVSFYGASENLHNDDEDVNSDTTKFDPESNEYFLPNMDDDEMETVVLMHNKGLTSAPVEMSEIESGIPGVSVETTESKSSSDDDEADVGDSETGNESDDESSSSELSAAEETLLADCLSKTLPADFTYERAAALAQTLKQRREDADSSFNNADASSIMTSSSSADVSDVDVEPTVVAPKKKLLFTPTPDADATAFFTPASERASNNATYFTPPEFTASAFKIPPPPVNPATAMRAPKKVLYLHTADDATPNVSAEPPPESPLRQVKMEEYERLRRESRAKAKLKSDRELGMEFGGRFRSVSQEGLSSPSKEVAEDETKRRAYSEEVSFAFDLVAGGKLSANVKATKRDNESASSAPVVVVEIPSSKKASIFSSFFRTGGGGAVVGSEARVTSESTKETNLLGKLGLRKYNRNKRGSSSPPKTDDLQTRVATATSGIAPKATVDEINLSDDTSPDETPRIVRALQQRAPPSLTNPDEAIIRALRQRAPPSTGTVPESMSVTSLQSVDSSSTVNDKDVRRVQRAVAKLAKQQEQIRAHKAQEIQRSMQEIEVERSNLESNGRDIEKSLRKDPQDKDLLQQWLNLVREKDNLLRRESVLNLSVQDLELENEHRLLQQELRERMNMAPFEKTSKDLQEEKKMLERCLDIVSRRDALVTKLERERVAETKQRQHVEKVLNKKGFNYRDFEPVFLAPDQSGVAKYNNKSALHSLV